MNYAKNTALCFGLMIFLLLVQTAAQDQSEQTGGEEKEPETQTVSADKPPPADKPDNDQPPSATAEKNTQIIERLYESLEKNMREENYDLAVSDIEQLVGLDPENKEYLELKSQIYYIRGGLYFMGGDYESALSEFDVSIQTLENTDALEARAKVYLFAEKWDRALADAETALALNPKLAMARSIISGVHFYREDYKKSIVYADAALQLDADDLLALEFRGASYAYLEKPALALTDLSRVLKKQPDNQNALTHRMIVYSDLNNWKAAREDAHHVLQLDADSALGYVYRAFANFSLKENYMLIISDFNRVEKLAPELMSSAVYTLRAGAYRMVGEDQKAAADDKKSEEMRLKEKGDNEQ